MSVELTQAILALHTIWSICVPIAIVESFAAGRRTTPWLRTPGFVVTALVYAGGAVLVFFGNYGEEHFLASPAQLGGVTLVIVLLVVLAFRVRQTWPPLAGAAPSPWLVGAAALAGTSLYWGPANLVTPAGTSGSASSSGARSRPPAYWSSPAGHDRRAGTTGTGSRSPPGRR